MKAAARKMSERAYVVEAHKYRPREIRTISSATEIIIRKTYRPIQGKYWGSSLLLNQRPRWGAATTRAPRQTRPAPARNSSELATYEPAMRGARGRK